MTTAPTEARVAEIAAGRFWLIVHEPGRVPERKGPWPIAQTATILREFIRARPSAYLHVITVDADGVPDVQHGPEVLQMLDGRSMAFARKHNARTRAAHKPESPYRTRWQQQDKMPRDGETWGQFYARVDHLQEQNP